MLHRTATNRLRKIGNDWSKRSTPAILREKLEMEKMFRDTWMRWTCKAVERCEEPLAHNLSMVETLAFQRKMQCYKYNQYGLSQKALRSLQWKDYLMGWPGNPGTGDWVSVANMANLTWYAMIRKGQVMVHRAHVRGYGTDPHLIKGGYEYRWKKTMDRDYARNNTKKGKLTWTRRSLLKSRSKESSFSVQFSPDDRYVATGAFDGLLVAYDSETGSSKFEYNVTPAEDRYNVPIMSFKFRPQGKEMILLGCCNGSVHHWDPKNHRVVNIFTEADNEVYIVDYRRDGNMFSTAGRDRTVRLYDETTGKLIRSFTKETTPSAYAAATRIYAMKWCPQDEHLLVTGGWENSLAVWDIRMEGGARNGCVGEMFGPYLCGDALDIHGSTIVTGSHRLDNRLELWDLSSLKKIQDVRWPSRLGECMITCAQFSKDGSLIAAGGGGNLGLTNMGVLLDARTFEIVHNFQADRLVNGCAFAHKGNLVAFGDAAGQVHLFDKMSGKAK